jgi:protein-tyrosine kinase
MADQAMNKTRPVPSLLVNCPVCSSSFLMNVALMKGVKGIRVRCRKCGALITVRNPQTPPPPPRPEGERKPSPPVGDRARQPSRPSPPIAKADPMEIPDPGPADPMPAGEGEGRVPAENGRKGWVSPRYDISLPVLLPPETLLRNRCVAFHPDAREVEHYRMLRTRILNATGENGGITLMITSALPGEGKTLTGINLALTFAKAFCQTSLLVDADLRQQKVHEVLGYTHRKGLADYLLDGCTVSDIMVWPGIEKLTLISGGRTVTESSELLGSPGMAALVEDLKSRYPNRYIFFDVPPVLTGADAISLAPLVDRILVVVRAERTPMPEVKKALAMLPKEKVLGLVLNRDSRPTVTKT